MLNALSVDIEDWFQVGAFENTIDRTEWDSLVPRVERNTEAVLELFYRMDAKATFFTLGWVAERYPQLIRRIVAQGHEIASHGWDRLRVFTMTPEQFRADIGRTRKTLEDVSGRPVIGYRAPSFSIDPRTPWAHPILAEQGYAYSSSVAPVQHDHYGWPDAPRFTFRPVAGSALIEIPVTTARLGSRNLPTGGGFFRLLPYRYSHWAYARANREDARPAVLYFHPWDIDPGQPRVANATLRSKLRHYTFLAGMEGKLERLLGEFDWGRMDDVAAVEAGRTR